MNIAKTIKGLKSKLVMAMLLPLLTSCATYNSSFACGDARGAACTSMDNVDRMIASGEIERFNRVKKNCRGRRCKSNLADGEIVLQSSSDEYVPTHYADIGEGEEK